MVRFGNQLKIFKSCRWVLDIQLISIRWLWWEYIRKHKYVPLKIQRDFRNTSLLLSLCVAVILKNKFIACSTLKCRKVKQSKCQRVCRRCSREQTSKTRGSPVWTYLWPRVVRTQQENRPGRGCLFETWPSKRRSTSCKGHISVGQVYLLVPIGTSKRKNNQVKPILQQILQ